MGLLDCRLFSSVACLIRETETNDKFFLSHTRPHPSSKITFFVAVSGTWSSPFFVDRLVEFASHGSQCSIEHVNDLRSKSPLTEIIWYQSIRDDPLTPFRAVLRAVEEQNCEIAFAAGHSFRMKWMDVSEYNPVVEEYRTSKGNQRFNAINHFFFSSSYRLIQLTQCSSHCIRLIPSREKIENVRIELENTSRTTNRKRFYVDDEYLANSDLSTRWKRERSTTVIEAYSLSRSVVNAHEKSIRIRWKDRWQKTFVPTIVDQHRSVLPRRMPRREVVRTSFSHGRDWNRNPCWSAEETFESAAWSEVTREHLLTVCLKVTGRVHGQCCRSARWYEVEESTSDKPSSGLIVERYPFDLALTHRARFGKKARLSADQEETTLPMTGNNHARPASSTASLWPIIVSLWHNCSAWRRLWSSRWRASKTKGKILNSSKRVDAF